jgi:hypothetical protein
MSIIPGYQEKKISKKLPKTTIILAIILAIFIIVAGVYIIGGVGVIFGFLGWLVASSVATLIWLGPQAVVGAVIVTAIFGLYLYRKSAYAKRKMLVPTGSSVPAADRLATPVFSDDIKVEST